MEKTNSMSTKGVPIRLRLHGTIYRPDSFVLMLRYCANLKAVRYESTSLNRIVADQSYRVIVALSNRLPRPQDGYVSHVIWKHVSEPR